MAEHSVRDSISSMQVALEGVLAMRNVKEKVVHMEVRVGDRVITNVDAASVLQGRGVLSEFVPFPCLFNDSGLPANTRMRRGDLIIWEASFEHTHKLEQLVSKDRELGYVAKHPQVLGISLPRRRGAMLYDRSGRWRRWVAERRRCFVIFLYNGQDCQGNKWGEQEAEMRFLNRRNTAFVWAAQQTVCGWRERVFCDMIAVISAHIEKNRAESIAMIAKMEAEVAERKVKLAAVMERILECEAELEAHQQAMQMATP